MKSINWGTLLQVLEAILSALVPILTKKAIAALPGANRATVRQWVVDALTEFGNDLIAKGDVPAWLQPGLPSIESLVAEGLDAALDAAGL